MFSSPQEIAVIALVGFVLFGAKKLPEMAKSLGSSIVEFKKALKAEPETAERAQSVAQQGAVQEGSSASGQLALPAQGSEPRRG